MSIQDVRPQTSVLTDFKSFITFVLLGSTQWKLDIRNQRKKLYRMRLTCKISLTKNLTQNFLAELFWVRQNFRLFFSSSDFFAKGLKRCAIKNDIDMQSLKTIGLSDKKLWAKNHVLDHTSLNIDHSSLTKIGKIEFFSRHPRDSPLVPFESSRHTQSVAVEFGKIHKVEKKLWPKKGYPKKFS